MARQRSRVVEQLKNMATASGEGYISTDLKIHQDGETNGILGATFGAMTKNILDIVWGAIGFDANVTAGYEQIMTDPDQAIEIKGRNYYPHPGLGNLRPYNDAGNPSGGVFSLYTMG